MAQREEDGRWEVEEEEVQYNRQICLWGLEAQKQLHCSRALVAVLHGWVRRVEMSLECIQDFSSMTDMKGDPENIEQKPDKFFTRFDMICLTCCTLEVLLKVDQILQKFKIKITVNDIEDYYGGTACQYVLQNIIIYLLFINGTYMPHLQDSGAYNKTNTINILKKN
uniref:Uncharacterized protein n=1 Tax=Naja naja TaxID=35670 RepID=A0A8C6X2U1_NAJNA